MLEFSKTDAKNAKMIETVIHARTDDEIEEACTAIRMLKKRGFDFEVFRMNPVVLSSHAEFPRELMEKVNDYINNKAKMELRIIDLEAENDTLRRKNEELLNSLERRKWKIDSNTVEEIKPIIKPDIVQPEIHVAPPPVTPPPKIIPVVPNKPEVQKPQPILSETDEGTVFVFNSKMVEVKCRIYRNANGRKERTVCFRGGKFVYGRFVGLDKERDVMDSLKERNIIGSKFPGSEFLTFKKECEFESPNLALQVVVGSARNSETCWKTETGMTLGEWRKLKIKI